MTSGERPIDHGAGADMLNDLLDSAKHTKAQELSDIMTCRNEQAEKAGSEAPYPERIMTGAQEELKSQMSGYNLSHVFAVDPTEFLKNFDGARGHNVDYGEEACQSSDGPPLPRSRPDKGAPSV